MQQGERHGEEGLQNARKLATHIGIVCVHTGGIVGERYRGIVWVKVNIPSMDFKPGFVGNPVPTSQSSGIVDAGHIMKALRELLGGQGEEEQICSAVGRGLAASSSIISSLSGHQQRGSRIKTVTLVTYTPRGASYPEISI